MKTIAITKDEDGVYHLHADHKATNGLLGASIWVIEEDAFGDRIASELVIEPWSQLSGKAKRAIKNAE